MGTTEIQWGRELWELQEHSKLGVMGTSGTQWGRGLWEPHEPSKPRVMGTIGTQWSRGLKQTYNDIPIPSKHTGFVGWGLTAVSPTECLRHLYAAIFVLSIIQVGSSTTNSRTANQNQLYCTLQVHIVVTAGTKQGYQRHSDGVCVNI